MQHQWWQREVVDPVDACRDLDLLAVVRVDLDQHLDAQRARLRREGADEVEGLRQHEAAAAGHLDRIADGVETHHADAVGREGLQDARQVRATQLMMHVDVDLLRREGGPQCAPLAVGQRDLGERPARSRPVDRRQLRLAGALREYRIERQEQAGVLRSRAMREVIAELRRVGRDVIDDDIAHHIEHPGQALDVLPVAEVGINLGMIAGVEAGVGAIDRVEERQQMHAAKHAAQRPFEQRLQLGQSATAQAVDIGDELNLVFHYCVCSAGHYNAIDCSTL